MSFDRGELIRKFVLCSMVAGFAVVSFACLPTEDDDMIDACTEAGCMDSLKINFVDDEGEPFGGFEGTVTYDDEEIEFFCGGDDICTASGIELTDAPSQLEVSVTAGEEQLSRTTTIEPDYEEFYPNGPDCPPTCYDADETVEVQ